MVPLPHPARAAARRCCGVWYWSGRPQMLWCLAVEVSGRGGEGYGTRYPTLLAARLQVLHPQQVLCGAWRNREIIFIIKK